MGEEGMTVGSLKGGAPGLWTMSLESQVPSTVYPRVGVCTERFRRIKKTPATAMPMTATPPTTPPTIGPVDERLRPLEDSEPLFPPPAFVLEFEPPSKPPGATMVTLGTLWDIIITLDFSKYETAIATSRVPTSTQAAQT